MPATKPTMVTVEVVLAHDGSSRQISNLARCPVCAEKFEDNQAVFQLTDLQRQESYEIHRTCIEAMLAKAATDGVSDEKMERFRKKLIKQYSG